MNGCLDVVVGRGAGGEGEGGARKGGGGHHEQVTTPAGRWGTVSEHSIVFYNTAISMVAYLLAGDRMADAAPPPVLL